MANAAEVARARTQIIGERPAGAVGEERALALADAGSTAYQQTENINVVYVPINSTLVDTWVYRAHVPCRVLSITEVHAVVAGAASTLRFRKVTDATSAPGAAASATVIELGTSFDLTAAVNTLQTSTLSTTATDIILAAGDKIGADYSGTIGTPSGGAFIAISALA
jgi:hypothetical protein